MFRLMSNSKHLLLHVRWDALKEMGVGTLPVVVFGTVHKLRPSLAIASLHRLSQAICHAQPRVLLDVVVSFLSLTRIVAAKDKVHRSSCC
jgi:hypothetical protein